MINLKVTKVLADSPVKPIPGFKAPETKKDTGKHPTGSDDWFYNKSEEEQKQYIEDHPNSKFAKQKGKKPEEKKEHKKGEHKHDEKTEPKKTRKLSHMIKNFNDKQKKFYKDGQYKPDSEERRKLGGMVKDKTKGIAKHIKNNVHEWKTAANCLRKVTNGEKLDHHDKKALKAVGIQAGIVIGDMALTGGMHSLGAVIGEFIHGMIHHTMLEQGAKAGHAAIYASHKYKTMAEKYEKSDEELLEELIGYIADGVTNANINPASWAKAMEDYNKKNKKKDKDE